MRTPQAVVTLILFVVVSGCGGRQSKPDTTVAPTPDASVAPTPVTTEPQPKSEQPVAAPPVTPPPDFPYLYPEAVMTPDGTCGQTILAQIKPPGTGSVIKDRDWCNGEWKDETTGYTLRGSLVKITPENGQWLVFKAYPYAIDPKPFSLSGASGSYPGVTLPQFMEKTGAAFWGPTPMEAVFVTERGAFHLVCSPEKMANDLEEGKAANRRLAEVCPSLLKRVQLGDLGKPVEPSFELPPLTVKDRTDLTTFGTNLFNGVATGEWPFYASETQNEADRFITKTNGTGLKAVTEWAAKAGPIRKVEVLERTKQRKMEIIVVKTDAGDFVAYLTFPFHAVAKITAGMDVVAQ